MKTYHFDVFDGEQLIRDEEGQEVLSLNAARDEAIEHIRELIGIIVRRGDLIGDREVRVREDNAGDVLTIGFRDVLEGRAKSSNPAEASGLGQQSLAAKFTCDGLFRLAAFDIDDNRTPFCKAPEAPDPVLN